MTVRRDDRLERLQLSGFPDETGYGDNARASSVQNDTVRIARQPRCPGAGNVTAIFLLSVGFCVYTLFGYPLLLGIAGAVAGAAGAQGGLARHGLGHPARP